MPLIEHIKEGGDLKDEPVENFVKWSLQNGKISTEPVKDKDSCQFLGGCIEAAGTDLERLGRLQNVQRRVLQQLPNSQEKYMSKLAESKSKSGKSRSFSQTGFDDKGEHTDTSLKILRVISPEKS